MRAVPEAPVLIVAGAGTTGECVHDLLNERGIAARTVTELSRFARLKGIERVVLLSGRGEPLAERAEAVLQASGIPWTSVRTSWLSQNFSTGYLLDGVLAGEIALPAPAGALPEPFTDANDVVDVVVAALSYEHHGNRTYEVTGPRALTFSEAVDEIAAGLGRPIRYVQIAPEDFVISMRAYVAENVVQLLHEFFAIARNRRNGASGMTHDVEEVLGRPARDFSHYVRDTVAAGTWSI
jgi:uncharacterized protein YbjT (DUF2867 family)